MVIGDLIILALTCQAAMENKEDKLLKKKLNKQQEKNLQFNYGQWKGQIADENA